MAKRPRSYWTKCNSLIVAPVLLLLLLLPALSGCADDRALVDRTLDARENALNAKDIDAYMSLFSQDYVTAKPGTDLRRQMEAKFNFYDSIFYESFARTVKFEDDTARVIQEYRLVTVDKRGKSQSIKGYDHFLLKKQGSRPFAKWLFYTGLDGEPPKQTPTPAPAEPAPETSPTPGDAS